MLDEYNKLYKIIKENRKNLNNQEIEILKTFSKMLHSEFDNEYLSYLIIEYHQKENELNKKDNQLMSILKQMTELQNKHKAIQLYIQIYE